jgi:hypothetical protein
VTTFDWSPIPFAGGALLAPFYLPSTRTLGRLAKATGMKPRISFEPEKRQSGTSRR